MLPSWCDDTVTVLRAPIVSARGSEVRDWGSASSHEVAGCSVQYATSASGDVATRAQPVSTTATIYLPPGADVRDGDRVALGGVTFELDGAPLRVRSPFGGRDHIIVSATARRG